jgi:nucleoside-diphosphate-sugar epimerase
MSAQHVILGTGAIGRSIMEELLKRKLSVRMVNRSGLMDELPAEVEVVAADLYDPMKVQEVTRGASVVYQAAQPEYSCWVEKFPPLQHAVIEGVTKSGAKLVIVENLYMYGSTDGKPLTENTPHLAVSHKGRTRSAMSKAAIEAHQTGRITLSIGRGSDYFGPWGVTALMGERCFYPLLKGKAAQLIGNVDLPHTQTYIRDFGRALVILGERQEADGQVWHVPNDRPMITQREMLSIIAETMGVESKLTSMGRFTLRIGGLFVPEAKETIEMMYEFEEPFIVNSSKFEKTFGVKATPLPEAIKESVNWYRNHPKQKSSF